MESNMFQATNPQNRNSNDSEFSQPKKKKSKLKIFGIILLVLLLMVASAAGGYLYKNQSAKKSNNSSQQQIEDLKNKNKELEDKLAKQQDAQSDKNNNSKESQKTNLGMNLESIQENIKDSITSNNTAALKGYMAPTVRVILAASEGLGDRTPDQAIADLKYINDATDPWNFDLPAATLNSWKAGFYKQYFTGNIVAGESANHYVISFTLNDDNKISTIFISSDSNMLR